MYDMETTEINDTSAETTQMYTSAETTQQFTTGSPLKPSTDPTSGECAFESKITLDSGENIEFAVCGYVTEDDEVWVALTFLVPVDRWVGVGLILNDKVDSENIMKNVYSIIIPAYSTKLQERYLGGYNNTGIVLPQQINRYYDVWEYGKRVVKVKRKADITFDDLTGTNTQYIDEYFSFNDFDSCDQEITVIYAFGANDNSAQLSYHKSNRGVKSMSMQYVNGIDCDESDSQANTITVSTSIMFGFVAYILLH